MNERESVTAMLDARQRGADAYAATWANPFEVAFEQRVMVRVCALTSAWVVYVADADGGGVILDEEMSMRDGLRQVARAVAHARHDGPPYAILKNAPPDALPPCPRADVEDAFARGYTEEMTRRD